MNVILLSPSKSRQMTVPYAEIAGWLALGWTVIGYK